MMITIALFYLSFVVAYFCANSQESFALAGNTAELNHTVDPKKARDNLYFADYWGSGGSGGFGGSPYGGYGFGGDGPGGSLHCSCGGDHTSHNCNCGCHTSGGHGYGNSPSGPYIGYHTSTDVCPWCGHTGRAITGPTNMLAPKNNNVQKGVKGEYCFFQRLLQFFEHWFG